MPKLRSGDYFPHWLLERRRRAEQALISVVATAYLLGVSTRRVEKLAESLGVTQLSKSQVSEMSKHLDDQVAAFRNRPLDARPDTAGLTLSAQAGRDPLGLVGVQWIRAAVQQRAGDDGGAADGWVAVFGCKLTGCGIGLA